VSIEEAVVVAAARNTGAPLAKRLLVRQEVAAAALSAGGLASSAWTAFAGHRAGWRLVLTPTGR
jgi:hypothetical protein